MMNIKSEFKRLAKEIYAFEFETEKQLKSYLQEHPLAERENHWVKPKVRKPIQDVFTNTQDIRKISDLVPTENMGKEISLGKLEKGKKLFCSGKKRAPITVREKNGRLEIVDGNTTYYILKSLGYQEIPITIDNNAITLRELQRNAIKRGVTKEELMQILPDGKKAGNSKNWIQKRLMKKTAMEFPTKEALEKYLKEHPAADKSIHHVESQKPLTAPPVEDVSPLIKTRPEPENLPNKPIGHVSAHTSIMRPEFDDLPASAKQQNIKNADDFYIQAQESHKDMTRLLDQGQGLDVKIGAKVIFPNSEKDFEDALNTDKPIIIIGSIKGKARATEKVNSDYGGDWSQLKDGVRATVSVKNVSDLNLIFKQLEELGMKLAQKPKDRYEKPTVSGYRDILLNIRYTNGHVGELQINCHDMLKAKIGGHKIYEQARTVEAKAKQEGRDTMTDEELAIVTDANKRMKALYETAYQKSLRG